MEAESAKLEITDLGDRAERLEKEKKIQNGREDKLIRLESI